MARLIVEDAVLATGRSPETIERWILEGKVDAERSGDDWVIDLSSLLNVAAAEEAQGNGFSGTHVPSGTPVDQSDEIGGRAGSIAEAVASHSFAEAALAEPEPPPIAEPVIAVVAELAEALPREPAVDAEAPRTGSVALANTAEPSPVERVLATSTVEVATSAIAALSARLEQAIGEIDRLQDERLKLALQLGYSQAQLKACNDQLRALAAPPEPDAFTRLFRWIFKRQKNSAGQ